MNRGQIERKVMSWKGWLLILGIILIVGFVAHLVLNGQHGLIIHDRDEQDALRSREEGLLRKKKEERDEVNSPGYLMKIAYENTNQDNRKEIHFEFDHPENLGNYTLEEWAILMEEVRY